MTDANGHELTELAQTARLLRDAITVVTPPPSLKGRVLFAVEQAATGRTPAPRSTRRRFRLAFGAGALAAAAAILVATLQFGGATGELELRAVLGSPNGAEAAVEVRKTGIGRVIELKTACCRSCRRATTRALVRRAGGHASEAIASRPARSTQTRTDAWTSVRRRRRPRALPGAERHRRAGRRRPAPDWARGAQFPPLGAGRISGRRAGVASSPLPALRRGSPP